MGFHGKTWDLMVIGGFARFLRRNLTRLSPLFLALAPVDKFVTSESRKTAACKTNQRPLAGRTDHEGERAEALSSFVGSRAVVAGIRSTRRNSELGQRLAWLIRCRLRHAVTTITATRTRDRRCDENDKKHHGEACQPDPDALSAAAGLIRHRHRRSYVPVR